MSLSEPKRLTEACDEILAIFSQHFDPVLYPTKTNRTLKGVADNARAKEILHGYLAMAYDAGAKNSDAFHARRAK